MDGEREEKNKLPPSHNIWRYDEIKSAVPFEVIKVA